MGLLAFFLAHVLDLIGSESWAHAKGPWNDKTPKNILPCNLDAIPPLLHKAWLLSQPEDDVGQLLR